MALRPRLSTGLPVSDDWVRQLNGAYITTPSKTRVKGLGVDKNLRFVAKHPAEGSRRENEVEGTYIKSNAPFESVR